jgi:hypothetical protein
VYLEVDQDLRPEEISSKTDSKVILIVHRCSSSRIKMTNNILNSTYFLAKLVKEICNKYELYTVGLQKINK